MTHHHEENNPLILVADDTPENIGVLMELFQAYSYEVRFAENGRVALQRAKEQRPDIILLDVMMPEMDGFETMKHLRETPETAEIPVMFMTALTQTSDKVRAFDMGAVDYITKPFEHQEVVARIQTHIKIARLQKRLKETNRKLEEANHLKNKFFRIARHDLRNPIAIIQLSADFIKHQCGTGKLVDDFEHKLDHIKRASAQMIEIVNNYLDNDELLALLDDLHKRSTRINEIVQQVVDETILYAQAKNINIYYQDHSSKEVWLDLDGSRMIQAISNLLNNAVKFSPEESNVFVQLMMDPNSENSILFEVKDQGPGIQEEDRDKLFGEGVKLRNKPTGNETSTGLGLWICKKIVEAHDGETGAYFPDGGGSVFWIRLPV